MSAASPPAPVAGGRTEWRGEDVELDEVAERLIRMNREHARAAGHAAGHASTRTLNLLVAPGADAGDDQIDAWLDSLSTRHPSRTIVLHEHAADRLDALLWIDCALGGCAGGTGYCHDTAVLHADADRLRHADSLVHALLIAGLPVVLWLPGAQPGPAEDALAPLAEAIVLDSGAAAGRGGSVPAGSVAFAGGAAETLPPHPDLRAAFARAARMGAATRVRDLAWQRLARWRQRVAARFDDPAARALLARTEGVELRCGGPDMAAPLLLAGWIVARAGWSLTELDGSGERWRGSARRPDGGEIALVLGPPEPGASALEAPALGALAIGPPPPAAHPPAPEGIHALTFTAANGEVLELVEPVAEPDAQRAFAAAVRGFDAPALGYAPALAALCEGMGLG